MIFARAMFWNRPDPATEEAIVANSFWRKCQRVAAKLPFARDLLAAYYCAFDNQTPLHVKMTLIGALAYFVIPTDVIPDFIPGLGFADDAASLAAAIRVVAAHIKPEHYACADAALERLARES